MGDAPDPDDDTPAQAQLRAGLLPGDILFYKTAAAQTFFDLSPSAFGDNFPLLAAFAQGLPYVLQPNGNIWSPDPVHFKPWHHVAICVAAADGDDAARAVGFMQANYDIEGEEDVDEVATSNPGQLVEYPIGPQPRQRLSVLRHDSLDTTPAITWSTSAAGGTEYSVRGLLAFALATKARMLPVGPVRTNTLLMAYGAHRRARDMELASGGLPAESCVTAVAKALEQTADFVDSFPLPEPDAPDPAESAKLYAYQLSPLTAALDELLARIDHAGGGLAMQSLKKMDVAGLTRTIPNFGSLLSLLEPHQVPGLEVLDAAVAEHELVLRASTGIGMPTPDGVGGGLGGNPGPNFGGVLPEPRPQPVPPGDEPYSPGPGLSTKQYIPKLEGIAEILTDDANDETSLVDLGKKEILVQPVPSSRHLVASPAMLWDELTGTYGFEEFFG